MAPTAESSSEQGSFRGAISEVANLSGSPVNATPRDRQSGVSRFAPFLQRVMPNLSTTRRLSVSRDASGCRKELPQLRPMPEISVQNSRNLCLTSPEI
jgi:hypothetical protein